MNTKKILAVAAAPAVLALGALGFASQQSIAQPNPAANTQATARQATNQQAEKPNAADTDNVQQGDQTSPDKPGQAEEKEASGPDRDNIQQGGGAQQGDQTSPDRPGAPAESGK